MKNKKNSKPNIQNLTKSQKILIFGGLTIAFILFGIYMNLNFFAIIKAFFFSAVAFIIIFIFAAVKEQEFATKMAHPIFLGGWIFCTFIFAMWLATDGNYERLQKEEKIRQIKKQQEIQSDGVYKELFGKTKKEFEKSYPIK